MADSSYHDPTGDLTGPVPNPPPQVPAEQSTFSNDISGFNLGNLKSVLGIGSAPGSATSAQVQNYASGLAGQIANGFKSQIGRDPTQGEIASVFNHFDFSKLPTLKDTNGVLDYNSFMTNPQGNFQAYGLGQDTINSHISALQPIFQQITEANNELQKYGQTLSPGQVSQIIGSSPDSNVNPDQSQKLVDSFVKAISEGKLQESINALPGQYNSAIDDFEKTLMANQGQYFNQYIAPTIEAQSNARYGGYQTGDLASALAQAGGQSAMNVSNITAPLRSQAMLGGIQNNYENTLRGALESGQSLNDATSFARQMYQLQNQQNFAAGQGDLNRQNQLDVFNRSLAAQLAMNSGRSGSSGLANGLGGAIGGASIGAKFGVPGALAGGFIGGLGGYFS